MVTFAALNPGTPLPFTLCPLSPVNVYSRFPWQKTRSFVPSFAVARQDAPFGVVVPAGMSSGGQMLRQLGPQLPFGCSYIECPPLTVTRIFPNPERVATLTTVADEPEPTGPIWAWAAAATPTADKVEPLTKSAATAARAVQDIPPAAA